MRLRIHQLTGDQEVLSGSYAGRQLLASLIAATSVTSKEGQVCFLDFANVSVATASFLRESVVAFRDYARAHLPVYPVVANADKDVLEELDLLLRNAGDAIVACTLDDLDVARGVQVLGHLEDKQRRTLELVVHMGETDAATLAARHGEEEKVGATAWNNRLAALVSKGLLMETPRGRSKLYRVVLGGV